MPQSSTNIGNSGFTDDYVSPTSGVLLGDLHELEPGSRETFRVCDITRLPLLLTENVTAFEDADLLEPDVVDDKSVRKPKTISVTFSFSQKPGLSSTYIVVTTPTTPYIPIEEHFGPSARQSRFYPDFFNIKRFVGYVMGRPESSPLEQRETSKLVRDIPVSIHPQVVREAEEKTLTDDLETTIQLVRETYPTLKKVAVNIEQDPEILDRKTIRFILTVSDEPETILENESLFKHRLRSRINSLARELITVTYTCEK